jgi:hypothetical protein
MEVDVYDVSDLLWFSESIGYHWNEAHDILLWDEILPINEIRRHHIYRGNFDNSSSYSDDTIKIINGFLDREKIEEFILV